MERDSARVLVPLIDAFSDCHESSAQVQRWAWLSSCSKAAMKRSSGVGSVYVSWFTVGIVSATNWYSMRTAGFSTAEFVGSYMAWTQ
jgi:hypothetical protein